MPAMPTLKDSLIAPDSPANTTTGEPVVVLLPLETDVPELAALTKPALVVTVTVSPDLPLTHVFFNVNDLLALVWVQLIDVSNGLTVNVVPLNGVALPVQASVTV